VVVLGLDLLDAPPEGPEGDLRLRLHEQRVGVHDVLRGDRTVAVVELDALSQVERPLGEVLVRRPLLGEPRRVFTGLRVHLEERLEERVVLQVIGARHHPEAVRVLEARGGEHQLLDGLRRRHDGREREGQCQDRDEPQGRALHAYLLGDTC
jgi:hypothetical protein